MPDPNDPRQRARDRSDEAFIRAIVGDRPDLFGLIPAPKAPEPPPTEKGSKE